MGETWNKKEREKKRQKNKQEKAERKQERREQSKDKSMDDMMAYLDENGNLTSTPPDPGKKVEFKLEDIEIGVPKQAPPTQEELLRKGKVSFFNDTKGFGFIRDSVTQESIFVHINNLSEPVGENDLVAFEVQKGPRGLNAVNVKKIG